MSMTNTRKLIGTRIRSARKYRRMTQEKLAHQSGLHRTYISSVESGKRNISIEALAKIAKGLRMKFKFIVEKM